MAVAIRTSHRRLLLPLLPHVTMGRRAVQPIRRCTASLRLRRQPGTGWPCRCTSLSTHLLNPLPSPPMYRLGPASTMGTRPPSPAYRDRDRERDYGGRPSSARFDEPPLQQRAPYSSPRSAPPGADPTSQYSEVSHQAGVTQWLEQPDSLFNFSPCATLKNLPSFLVHPCHRFHSSLPHPTSGKRLWIQLVKSHTTTIPGPTPHSGTAPQSWPSLNHRRREIHRPAMTLP